MPGTVQDFSNYVKVDAFDREFFVLKNKGYYEMYTKKEEEDEYVCAYVEVDPDNYHWHSLQTYMQDGLEMYTDCHFEEGEGGEPITTDDIRLIARAAGAEIPLRGFSEMYDFFSYNIDESRKFMTVAVDRNEEMMDVRAEFTQNQYEYTFMHLIFDQGEYKGQAYTYEVNLINPELSDQLFLEKVRLVPKEPPHEWTFDDFGALIEIPRQFIAALEEEFNEYFVEEIEFQDEDEDEKMDELD